MGHLSDGQWKVIEMIIKIVVTIFIIAISTAPALAQSDVFQAYNGVCHGLTFNGEAQTGCGSQFYISGDLRNRSTVDPFHRFRVIFEIDSHKSQFDFISPQSLAVANIDNHWKKVEGLTNYLVGNVEWTLDNQKRLFVANGECNVQDENPKIYVVCNVAINFGDSIAKISWGAEGIPSQ